jgi:hypothetical protein
VSQARAADREPAVHDDAAAPSSATWRAPDPRERVLALQRTAGNRAVGRLLQRQELGVIDSQPEPELGSLPANRYVDLFTESYYDLSYRAEGGALSKWLTLEYADGTLIDVNVDDILDADEANTSMPDAMRAGYVGIGDRIFPSVMTRQTVPRLWNAKRGAIQVMEEYNYEFMLTALPAVFFILSMAGAAPIKPVPARGVPRLRARPRSGSTGTPGASAAPGATAAAGTTRQAVGFTRHARGAPELGGYRSGISADEITALNRQFGGVTTITGHPSSALAAASRHQGFWMKTAAIVREIAGRHMFNDANKRTATAVVNELTRRNNVFTGVQGSALRDVIHRVATGQLRTVEEIARALRGF